jgi:dienelactone hydrolase
MPSTILLIAAFFAAQPLAGDDFAALKKLYSYDTAQPLDVQSKPLYERGGVRVEDLSYASPKSGRATAFLVAPAGAGEKRVAVLFGHWGQGTKTEFLPEATLYARAGAVCLLVDNPWVRPAPWRKNLRQLEDPNGDREAFIQAAVDLRRGLDLLAGRKDVDSEKLAYVGHSFGAQFGAILSAVDGRLKAVVLMGGVPDAEAIWRDGTETGLVEYRARAPKDRQEAYLKAVAPTSAIFYVPHSTAPLLFQFARIEQYFDEPAMRRYHSAAKEPKKIEWYDTGHDLNDPAALASRAKWLSERVGLSSITPLLRDAIEQR